MNRFDFIRKLVQAGLLVLLTFLVLALRKRIVTGAECQGCPVLGSCMGKNECIRN
jgi:hypothetical protein